MLVFEFLEGKRFRIQSISNYFSIENVGYFAGKLFRELLRKASLYLADILQEFKPSLKHVIDPAFPREHFAQLELLHANSESKHVLFVDVQFGYFLENVIQCVVRVGDQQSFLVWEVFIEQVDDLHCHVCFACPRRAYDKRDS